jgi:hypothetical protein
LAGVPLTGHADRHCPRRHEFKPCANPRNRAKTLRFLAAQYIVADMQQIIISAFA